MSSALQTLALVESVDNGFVVRFQEAVPSTPEPHAPGPDLQPLADSVDKIAEAFGAVDDEEWKGEDAAPNPIAQGIAAYKGLIAQATSALAPSPPSVRWSIEARAIFCPDLDAVRKQLEVAKTAHELSRSLIRKGLLHMAPVLAGYGY